MDSEVAICNAALIDIGEPIISSLTEIDSRAAESCAVLYPVQRDVLLRQYDWKFACHRISLAASIVVPNFQWSTQFVMPTDCLRVREVYSSWPTKIEYEIEETFIFVNSTVLELKYVRRVTDVLGMDVSFKQALASRIASKLAVPLSDSDEKKATMLEQFEYDISQAMFLGAIEIDDVEQEQEDFEDHRIW